MNYMGHYKHTKRSIRRSKGSLSNSLRCNSRISMKTKAMTETNVAEAEVEAVDEVEIALVDKVGTTTTIIPTATTRKGKAQHEVVEEAI